MESPMDIERFHFLGQRLCKFIEKKKRLRKELISHRIGLDHQHGWGDVMWKRSISGWRVIEWNDGRINSAKITRDKQIDKQNNRDHRCLRKRLF